MYYTDAEKRSQLIDMINRGRCTKHIADTYGITASAIHYYLKKYGLSVNKTKC